MLSGYLTLSLILIVLNCIFLFGAVAAICFAVATQREYTRARAMRNDLEKAIDDVEETRQNLSDRVNENFPGALDRSDIRGL